MDDNAMDDPDQDKAAHEEDTDRSKMSLLAYVFRHKGWKHIILDLGFGLVGFFVGGHTLVGFICGAVFGVVLAVLNDYYWEDPFE